MHHRRTVFFARTLLLTVCALVLGSRSAGSTGLSTSFGLPPPRDVHQTLSLWATWYHAYPARPQATGPALLNLQGTAISAPLSQRDWCFAALEGTVVITSPAGEVRTYNYAGVGRAAQVECKTYFPNAGAWLQATNRSRFAPARGPYGDGAAGFILVPYRTLAVDRRLIPLGTVLYIAAARGQQVTLPSGEVVVHDGYFFAGDVGGAIKGDHIDVFAGTLLTNPFPAFVKSTAAFKTTAVVVDDPAVVKQLRALHAP